MLIAALKNKAVSSVGAIFLLAIAYVVFGRLALMLAIPPGFATAIFPPVGISLAAVLIWGRHLLAGVFLGSTVLNLTISVSSLQEISGSHLLIACCIALGTTLQCLVASTVIKRVVGFPNPLIDDGAIFKTFIIGGPLSCVISASAGPMVLFAAGVVDNTALPFSMWTWWVGDTIGVLIALPIMMILFAEPRGLWRMRLGTVGLPIILGSLVVVFLFFRSSEIQQESQRTYFHEEVKLINLKLDFRLSQYAQIVGFMEKFNDIKSEINMGDFRALALPVLNDYPDIAALSWNEFVLNKDRENFELKMSSIHSLPFSIKVRNADGYLKKSPEESYYAPITYIEPYGLNKKALGYDPLSNSRRSSAFLSNEKDDKPRISELIDTVQDSKRKGFLLVKDVYNGRIKDSPLIGYVVALIIPSEIISHAFKGLSRADFLIKINDISNGKNEVVYSDDLSASSSYASSFKSISFLKIGGRQFQIVLIPSESYLRKQQSMQAWLVLAGGLVLCTLLGGFLLILSGRAELVRQQVRRQTIELTAILENAAEGIIIFSENGDIELVNPAAEIVFRGDANCIKKLNILYLIPNLAPLNEKELSNIYGKNCEFIGSSVGGDLLELELSLSCYDLPDRKRFICLVRDISDRKQVDRLKSEFVATVSHELRTPLTSIKGSLELVQAGVAGEINKETNDLISMALQNSERLAILVDDLLDIERLKHGQVGLQLVPINLLKFIKESVSHSLGFAHKFNIKFEFDIKMVNTEVEVSIDRLRLQQVMANLLSNAIKFSPSGSTVTIQIIANESTSRVNIIDLGPGIPDNFKGRLFERFAQADSSDRRQQGGTGLGLNICKTLIERMNGQIGCTSVFGHGSTFYFSLPIVKIVPTESDNEGEISKK